MSLLIDPYDENRRLADMFAANTDRFARFNEWADAINRDRDKVEPYLDDEAFADYDDMLTAAWRALDAEWLLIDATYIVLDEAWLVLTEQMARYGLNETGE